MVDAHDAQHHSQRRKRLQTPVALRVIEHVRPRVGN
jgi:hypothetical protein